MASRTLVLAMMAVASRANAEPECGDGDEIPRVVFAVGALLVDTPLVIHDVVVDRSSRAYGIAEAVLTAPQIAIAIDFMADECFNDEVHTGGTGLVPVVLLGSSALLAHAIYVIATSRNARPTSTPHGR